VSPPGPAEGDELDGRTDRELLAAHVDGDGEAFGVLVQRHRSRLWAVAVRTLRDPEDAADALQDALVSAYRGAASFRGDSAVTTWLHRVVVNACLDRLRREKVRPTVPLPEHHDPASPRDEHARTDARLDVMSALARLPEGHRTAIVLVDLQELSVAEAAEVLGVAEGTVKSRCSRGRAMLAELLRPAPSAQDEGAAAPGAAGNRPPGSRVQPGDPPARAPDDADRSSRDPRGTAARDPASPDPQETAP
jgi:RNA polymerase sigma-70 factor (ECF subfamily)